MSATELLPCPHCGAHLPRLWSLTLEGNEHRINCTECPARVECRSSTREQAIDAWNRRAIAPPVAAGSVDTIRTMICTYRHLPKIHSDEAWEARQAHIDAIMNSIAAWGAQQRAAGHREGYADGKGMAAEIVAAIDKATRVRAEKAEAELEDWSQSNKLDELQRELIALQARAKELEAQLARRQAPLSPAVQQAIAAARAAGQTIAATLGGLVFLNDGTGPGEGELDCPACGGSGHAGDVVDGGAA